MFWGGRACFIAVDAEDKYGTEGCRASILVTFKEKNLIVGTTGFKTGFSLKIRDKGPEL